MESIGKHFMLHHMPAWRGLMDTRPGSPHMRIFEKYVELRERQQSHQYQRALSPYEKRVDFEAARKVFDEDAWDADLKLRQEIKKTLTNLLQTVKERIEGNMLTPQWVGTMTVDTPPAVLRITGEYLMDVWRKGRDLALKELPEKVAKKLADVKRFSHARLFHLPGQHDQCDHSVTGECVDPEWEKSAENPKNKGDIEGRQTERAKIKENNLRTTIKAMGVDEPDKVRYGGKGKTFSIGAHPYETQAEFNQLSGTIEVYDGAFDESDKVSVGVIAHELQHASWAKWKQQSIKEFETLRGLEAKDRQQYAIEKGSRFSLTANGERRFPALALDNYLASKRNERLLIKEDGISQYSTAHWVDYKETGGRTKPDGIFTPINETLAEVARFDAERNLQNVPKFWRDLYKRMRLSYAR